MGRERPSLEPRALEKRSAEAATLLVARTWHTETFSSRAIMPTRSASVWLFFPVLSHGRWQGKMGPVERGEAYLALLGGYLCCSLGCPGVASPVPGGVRGVRPVMGTGPSRRPEAEGPQPLGARGCHVVGG